MLSACYAAKTTPLSRVRGVENCIPRYITHTPCPRRPKLMRPVEIHVLSIRVPACHQHFRAEEWVQNAMWTMQRDFCVGLIANIDILKTQ